jgi:hypothetical protein
MKDLGSRPAYAQMARRSENALIIRVIGAYSAVRRTDIETGGTRDQVFPSRHPWTSYRPGSLLNLNRGSSHAEPEDKTSAKTGQAACTAFQTLRQALERGESRSTEEIPLPKTRGYNTQIR